MARKHCGGQREWRIGLPVLHAKAGSDAPQRVFRAAIRRMIAADLLPDYSLAEEAGDVIRVTRRALIEVPAEGPLFGADTVEAVRGLAPGWDPYVLEAEWRSFWAATGRPRLRAPQKAYLAWVRGRVARG